jgi:Neuraminidase (sialidase)
MRNNRNKMLWYFALPVVLLAVCVLQPSLASAQMTSLGIDCSKIDVSALLKEDNLGAGRILIECGIVRGGHQTAGTATKLPTPPNVRVSNGSDCSSSSDVCGSESMVAGSTKNKGKTIVVNYNANYAGAANYSGTSYSSNGGATFTEIQPAPFANGHGENFGDPLVVFNSKLGKFFAGDLATGCGGQGIGLWTSTNGKTWTTGACPSNNSADDRPSMWADNNPTSGTYGRMYISFNDFNNSGGALDVVYSDNGTTWTGPVVVSATGTFMRDVQITGSPRGAALVEGKNSTVFLASMDEGGGGNATRQNVMFKSIDGGKTWTTTIMGPRFNPPGDSACATNSYFWQVNPIIRHMGWGEPAVGPQGVVHYVYAGHGKGNDTGDIFYQKSTDNGKTWSKAIKLNTDKDGTFKEQWMPSLSATSDGTVTASWYDRRKATTACNSVGDPGCNYERVGRQSKTNGASWGADITISTGIITQPAQDDGGVQECYAGDYDYDTALSAADSTGTGNAYVTWTDGRHSISGVPVQSVDFAKVPEP